MLDLTNSGKFVMSVQEGSQFTLPTGETVSPAYAGWSYKGYTLQEAVVQANTVESNGLTLEEQQTMRLSAYRKEADPLFFKWQAGEGTESDWKAKRQEIRERYPYPGE